MAIQLGLSFNIHVVLTEVSSACSSYPILVASETTRVGQDAAVLSI